ncbi:MAG: hypothetical protein AAF637_28335 [Pseudomonadota bacterium]
MSLIVEVLELLKSIAGQPGGLPPRAAGRLRQVTAEQAAFEKSGSSVQDRDMSGSITLSADTRGLSRGHRVEWVKGNRWARPRSRSSARPRPPPRSAPSVTA